MRRSFAFVLPCLAVSAPLMAQTPAAQPEAAPRRLPSHYVLWENDGGWLKPNHQEDKHYTNGLLIGLSFHPEWADRLADSLPAFGGDFGEDPQTAAGVIVGQLMFTADDIETTAIIEDDRPFAGYLFAGGYWQRAGEVTFDHVQVELGVTGDWSLAEDAQDWVHDWYGGDEPEGWVNQIEEEVTLQTYARRKWRIPLNSIERGDNFKLDAQLIPHVGIALGTVHRNLEAGATFRFGFNLPDDFGPSRISDLPGATGTPREGWSLYAFTGVAGRAVEYNHFLEGGHFTGDPHTVDEEPLVGEASLGAALGFRGDGWAAAIHYSQTFLTEEFKAQNIGDDYATLGVSLSASF